MKTIHTVIYRARLKQTAVTMQLMSSATLPLAVRVRAGTNGRMGSVQLVPRTMMHRMTVEVVRKGTQNIPVVIAFALMILTAMGMRSK